MDQGQNQAHIKINYFVLIWVFSFSWKPEDFLIAIKPTYEELEQRIKELEKEAVERKRGEKELVKREER